MDIFEQLAQSFFKNLRSLLDLAKSKIGKELDDLLAGQGRDEEEKRVIREVCEEIDLEHEMMEDLKRSEKEPGPWFEQQVVDTVTELFPDATAEEIEEVKNATLADLEGEIERDANALEKEIELIQSLEVEENEYEHQQGEEDQNNEA